MSGEWVMNILGSKSEGKWQETAKTANEERNHLLSALNIYGCWIKGDKIGGHVARMGETKYAHRIFVWKLESKKLFGRSAHRREDNIKINLNYIGCEGVDWIQLA